MSDEWLEQVYWRLMRFHDVWLPDMELPYTRDGLERFEAYLLKTWPDMETFVAGNDSDFVECASAYMGEVFMRVYGGGWYIDRRPKSVFYGPPAFCLDTEDRTPIQPYFKMTSLLKRRTGRELIKIYDWQQESIDERRAEMGPTWRPSRDPIPGVTTEDDTGDAPSAEQLEWELGIEDRLSALRARVSPEVARQLDLSTESLPTLAILVMEEFAHEAELRAGEDGEPYRQFVTYVGEVLLRDQGGHWVWRSGERSATNYTIGRPIVMRQAGPGDAVVESPYLALFGVVNDRDPSTGFQRMFENYRA